MMKKLVFAGSFLLVLLWGSCKKDLQNTSSTSQSLDKSLYDDYFIGENTANYRGIDTINPLHGEAGWFPAGSDIQQIGNSDIRIIPPTGWQYIGRDENGNIHAISGGVIDISCSCTEGSGCDPYIKGKEHCCNMKTNCTKCDKTVKSRTPPLGMPTGFVFTVKTGGFVNPEAGVQFDTHAHSLPMAFEEMFEVGYIAQAVQSFIEENELEDLIATNEPEDDCYQLMLSLFGRRAMISIPKAIVDKADTTPLVALSEFISQNERYNCSCTEGSCIFKSFMGVKYCESDNCSGTCTLSSSAIINGENPPSKVYKF